MNLFVFRCIELYEETFVCMAEDYDTAVQEIKDYIKIHANSHYWGELQKTFPDKYILDLSGHSRTIYHHENC